MKALVLFSSSDFPLSAVAGNIFLKQLLSEKISAVELLDLIFARNDRRYSGGRMRYLGENRQGIRVVAFSCRSGKVMLKNLITTFLEMYGIDTNHCRIVEIKTPGGFLFLMGELLSILPPATFGGRPLMEKYIKKIYPRLVETVKLDCNFQISDN
ncbi:MAG: hypothetical protein VR68_01730 [Peptococcaceae bacterium BRH_c4a]|nr:MAG: hypothetical protein VR68_01730 [Peptococcaceae bacterium BRH_c4a]